MTFARRTECGDDRAHRACNKLIYRFLHWPIWILVFFLTPGRVAFHLFAGHATRWTLAWLAVVLIGTGIAALRGRIPGTEAQPYILRFTEDRPNPLYRRVCYTFAWNAVINFALMNLLGLLSDVTTGVWEIQFLFERVYPLVLVAVLVAGAAGLLPRVRPSTRDEGTERRYFYGSVWAVTLAQTALLLLCVGLPKSPANDFTRLCAYLAVLITVGLAAACGMLPRTAPILPGEQIAAD